LGLHGEDEQSVEDPVGGSIDGPVGEGDLPPTQETHPLEMLPHRDRQEGTKPVIRIPNHGVIAELRSVRRPVLPVTFIPEILEDLVRIEGKANESRVDPDIVENVVEGTRHPRGAGSRRGGSVTDRLGAECEVSGILREPAGELERRQVLGTAVMID